MRGSVSLAAALALPLTIDSGAPFPERDLIIFLAFAVILFTLVVQGLTLPLVIERAGFCDDGAEEREELHARVTAVDAALERLDRLSSEDWTRDETVDRVRRCSTTASAASRPSRTATDRRRSRTARSPTSASPASCCTLSAPRSRRSATRV